MAEWCRNRFEITGKSVCLDVLIQWIEGNDASRYRHAIQQSILLFLAGCAGILKPVRTETYPPYPGLVSHGAGSTTVASQAWEVAEHEQPQLCLIRDTARRTRHGISISRVPGASSKNSVMKQCATFCGAFLISQ